MYLDYIDKEARDGNDRSRANLLRRGNTNFSRRVLFYKEVEMSHYYVGIDPGATGGIAIIESRFEEPAKAWRYPSDIDTAMGLLRDIFHDYKPSLVAIEQVHAMPGQGVTGMFKFGMNYGAWLGALSMYQIPHMLVTPRTWQKAMLDAGTGETKDRSLNMARRLFPEVELKYKKDDGMADALHLARWARERRENVKE